MASWYASASNSVDPIRAHILPWRKHPLTTAGSSSSFVLNSVSSNLASVIQYDLDHGSESSVLIVLINHREYIL